MSKDQDQALLEIKRLINTSMIQSRFGIFDKILDVIDGVQNPKPPAPTVEVGQVWRHIGGLTTDSNYYIKSLGTVKVNEEWQDSVTYWKTIVELDPREFTRALSDFIAKFEQVQP